MSLDSTQTNNIGPEYVITAQVATFHGITRFGRSSYITDLLSSDQDAQASYAAGLMLVGVFSFTFFAFWAIAVLTFKCMGYDGGFLSGKPIKVSSGGRNRFFTKAFVLRFLFLLATLILWMSAVLLLVKGVTELDDTADAADNTLTTMRSKIEAAEDITAALQEVGSQSIKIRDKVFYLSDTVMCDSVDIKNTLQASITDAKDDLNKLSNFFHGSIDALISAINTANNLTTRASDVVSDIRFGGWPAILVSGFLFILPAFFVVGVSMAIADFKAKQFGMYLSYVILPMFMGVVGFCVVVCCILIPVAVMNADFCTGSISSGGPDETILTSYRNLLGNDQSIRFYVLAYYTQRCQANYYPYGFFGKYFDNLSTAQTSIDALIRVLSSNLNLIRNQCGSDDGELFLSLAQSMKSNLDVLIETVDNALSLVDCSDINDMYVHAVHGATCTQAPTAFGWIYGTLLAISISGMIMITLRSAYLPSAQELNKVVSLNSNSTGTPSLDMKPASSGHAQESAYRLQKLYRDRQNYRYRSSEPRNYVSADRNSTTQSYLPSSLALNNGLEFEVITPSEQDDEISELSRYY